MSAAASLVGMLLFAATGITLNHAASISARAQVTGLHAQLSRADLAALKAPAAADASVPPSIARLIDDRFGLDAAGKPGEWSDEEVYLALPRPGGDAWVSIDRATGEVSGEITDRGWISFANDLHKGRNTGSAWSWFIDIFAVACVLFTLTGLALLYMHAKPRPLTWPLVGIGLAIPIIIVIMFIH